MKKVISLGLVERTAFLMALDLEENIKLQCPFLPEQDSDGEGRVTRKWEELKNFFKSQNI